MPSTHNLRKYFPRDWFQNEAKCQELDRSGGGEGRQSHKCKEGSQEHTIGLKKQMRKRIRLYAAVFMGNLKCKQSLQTHKVQAPQGLSERQKWEGTFCTKFGSSLQNQWTKSFGGIALEQLAGGGVVAGGGDSAEDEGWAWEQICDLQGVESLRHKKLCVRQPSRNLHLCNPS